MKERVSCLPKLVDRLADTDTRLPGATSLLIADSKLKTIVEVKVASSLIMKHR